MKTAQYWHKNREVEQRKRTKDLDINPHTYELLIFEKEEKNIKWKKERIFSRQCLHNWISTCRRMKIGPYLSPYTKLKVRWIKDLNIKPTILNLIEKKVGSKLKHTGTTNHFPYIIPVEKTL